MILNKACKSLATVPRASITVWKPFFSVGILRLICLVWCGPCSLRVPLDRSPTARGSALVLLPSPDRRKLKWAFSSLDSCLSRWKARTVRENPRRQEGKTEAVDASQPHLLLKFSQCRTEPNFFPLMHLQQGPRHERLQSASAPDSGPSVRPRGLGVLALAGSMG